MKKIILVLSLVSALLLTGCGNNKVNESQDLNDNTQIENVEQFSGDNEIVKEEENTEIAKTAIISALKDGEWVKENVSMKKTCFDEEFTLPQELTYEMLREDLAIVQAFAYETDGDIYNFGSQVFLVGYFDGEVKTVSFPAETPVHPGHSGFGIDSEKMILVYYWIHQGMVKNTAYDINEFSFKEIDSISIDTNVVEDFETQIEQFDNKYNTHEIEMLLTEGNLDK